MKFACDRCGKKFSSTDEPVSGRVYRIQCKCGNVITVRAGDVREKTPAPSFAAPPAAARSLSGPLPGPGSTYAAPGAPPAPDVPQFEGDPFAAEVSARAAPSAHPAATPDSDLGFAAPAGATAAPRVATPAPLVLETPTPSPGPSRQGFPMPLAFSEADAPLELDRGGGLATDRGDLEIGGGRGHRDAPPIADDPFAVAAGLQRPSLAHPMPSVTAPLSGPSRIPPPSFARIPAPEQPVDLAREAPSIGRPPTPSGRGPVVAVVAALVVLGGALGAWYYLVVVRAPAQPPVATNVATPRPRPSAAPAPPPVAPAVAPAPAVPAPPPPVADPPPRREPQKVARRERTATTTVVPIPAAPAQEAAPVPAAAEVPAPAGRKVAAPPPAPPAAEVAPPSTPRPPTARPAATAAPATAVKAALEPADVVAVLRQHRAEFDGCIQQAVGNGVPGPWLGRRVELLVLVNPNGRVAEPVVDDPEVEPSALGACLREVARGIVFPAFRGEAVPVAIPLRLGKAD
jgi:hypothetical protein